MTYVESCVLAVPQDKKDAYRQAAEAMAVIFKDHGALNVVECWGQDVPDGKLTSFPMAVKAAETEAVVVAWIIWPSKDVFEAGHKTAMDDPRMQEIDHSMIDGKRMIFGGFEKLVDL